jgi:two-component system, chemotaxis family, chemotaxis protein CheY
MALVLLIDDSQTLRSSVKKLLESNGVSCCEADNGMIAQEVFVNDPEIKLIITDYNMPELDGIATVRKIRQLPGGKDVMVFMLTTESSPDLKNLGKDVGVKAWVTKPYNEEKFMMAVKKILGLS